MLFSTCFAHTCAHSYAATGTSAYPDLYIQRPICTTNGARHVMRALITPVLFMSPVQFQPLWGRMCCWVSCIVSQALRYFGQAELCGRGCGSCPRYAQQGLPQASPAPCVAQVFGCSLPFVCLSPLWESILEPMLTVQ
jgi:hypothetical protein